MIAAAWAWAVAGIVLFLAVGLLVMLLLGLVGLPGAAARRAGQATGERSRGGTPLPDEVPDASAEEVAEQVEESRER